MAFQIGQGINASWTATKIVDMFFKGSTIANSWSFDQQRLQDVEIFSTDPLARPENLLDGNVCAHDEEISFTSHR